MIIKCKNCSRRFIAKDSDIPKNGRTVQCGYCSITWHQMPQIVPRKIIKTTDEIPIDNTKTSANGIEASDGKKYKYLGNQWSILLPSGKTGIFAKKKIGIELDKIAGIVRKKTSNKISQKSKVFDPSSVSQSEGGQLPDIYKPKNGIGFFGYIFILLIVFLSLVGAIKTFEDYWLYYFPQDILFFAFIDQQLDFFAETFKNMITIVKDLIDSY
jgi:predicted Zn finger-like uncharacterized protein